MTFINTACNMMPGTIPRFKASGTRTCSALLLQSGRVLLIYHVSVFFESPLRARWKWWEKLNELNIANFLRWAAEGGNGVFFLRLANRDYASNRACAPFSGGYNYRSERVAASHREFTQNSRHLYSVMRQKSRFGCLT